ncbi:MAG TPA: hypothetical protein VGI30_03655 [Caulobacteraceae bacterium]|jgi:hypothetical protein
MIAIAIRAADARTVAAPIIVFVFLSIPPRFENRQSQLRHQGLHFRRSSHPAGPGI